MPEDRMHRDQRIPEHGASLRSLVPPQSGLNLRQREGIRDEHSFGSAKHPKSATPVSDLLRRSERQWLYR
jgi:hypothetical protein